MSENPPVILVHGLLRSKYSMAFLAWQLRRAGYRTHLFGYKSRKRSLDENCIHLAAFVEKVRTQNEPLHFVTHSLGSLLVRAYLQHEAQAQGRFVMLGPPNKGARLAEHLSSYRLFRNFLSKGLEAVQNPFEHDCRPYEIGIIAGNTFTPPFHSEKGDGIVSLSETELDYPHERRHLCALHSIMMYSPTVIAEVITFLKTGKFREGKSPQG